MNEFLRNFIMTAVRDMVKSGVALYQTYQYASGWFSKGVLVQEDLQEIEKMYEEKEIISEETQITNEVTEDRTVVDVAENEVEEEV